MGKYKRASGILVHITSLPGPNGIGDLGREAYKFVDFLKECDQSIWQILPLTATELPSPYTGISAFAGNALLISLEKLVNDKLLEQSDIESNRPKFDDQVNFKQVNKWKYSVLRRAYQKYKSQFVEKYRSAMQQFIEKERYWLDDFTLYMALKNEYNEKSWSTWAKDLKERKAEALEKKRQEHADLIHEHTFYQYIFFQQWNELKAYANQAGIQIFGDMPVYVDYNSADCWANQSLFQLDEETRLPTAVAGAPPDMFSEDGQLWNSPLYDWTGNMRKNKFDWWIKRLRKSLETVDVVRIDHFRGLEAYWSIPVGPDHVALSPKKGQWVKACGDDFLSATMEALGKDLPIIAEDLGSLTQEVFDLRDKFNLVGMRVLHFGFLDVPESIHLPHNYIQNCIAYTGTHDNNTTIAWYRHNTSAEEKENMVKYLQKEGDIERNIHWSMIQLVMASVADSAVIPFQDVLGLAEGCRMNDPALPPGYEENWRWRFQWSQLNQEMKDKLKLFTNIYGRTTVDKSAAMETTSASQDEQTIPTNKTDTKSAQKVQSSS